MKNISHKNSGSRTGQSLIEAMAALGILTVGLVGVLTLLSRSFLLQRETADEAKATYLASEGLEITKSLIDHGVYAGVAQAEETNGWDGDITQCFNFSQSGKSTHEVDFTTVDCSDFAPVQQGDKGAGQLCLATGADNVPRYYDCDDKSIPSGATPTGFYRLVTVSRPDKNTIDVVSTVTWDTGTITNQSVTVEDTFYNWHP